MEPHAHGVAEPAQCLNVRHAATKFDARQCGLADASSLCDFLLGKVPASADRAELVAQPQVPACLLVFRMLGNIADLCEAPGLEGLPSAVPGHHAFLSNSWVIVKSCAAWQFLSIGRLDRHQISEPLRGFCERR